MGVCILIVKILFLFIIFLIALLLIIFSESVHISITLKNNNLSYFGVINIKYYFFQIIFDIKSRQLTMLINSKFLTKKITTITQDTSSDETDSDDDSHEDDPSKDVSEESNEEDDVNLNKIKQLLKLIYDSKRDIMDLIISVIKLISFKNSYILMNLGLGDNNLTIKTCNKLWAITAPFYTIGLQTILTPQLNETILKSEVNIFLEVELLKILKLIKKVLFNKNIRNIILFYIKSLD